MTRSTTPLRRSAGTLHALLLPILLASTTLPLAVPLSVLAPTPAYAQDQSGELVPYEIARARIDAHLEAIAERRRLLEGLYGYDYRKATLADAFAAHGVDDLAYGYVDSWSGDVYLTWDWAAEFYNRHRYTLEDSRRAIGRDGIAEEHLAYIDRGMQAWLSEEQKVGPLMEQYVDLLAQRARYLGEGLRLTQGGYVGLSAEEAKALREANEEQRRLANAVPVGRPRKAIEDIARRQLFSAIASDPQDRIPVPGPPDDDETIPISEPEAKTCPELRGKREALLRELERLQAQKLPQETLREWANVLSEIREAAKGIGADGKDVAKRIRDATTIAERLREGLGAFVARIAQGVEKYTGAISEATKFLDDIIADMNETADIIERADSGSAQAQIIQLRRVIDIIRKRTPVGRIPGLSELLDAYSQAIEHIAESVGIIEDSIDESNRRFRDIAGKDLRLRTRSNRERLAEARTQVQDQIDALDAQLVEKGCNPRAQGICEPRRPAVDAALASALSQQEELENRLRAARQRYHALAAETARLFREHFDAETALSKVGSASPRYDEMKATVERLKNELASVDALRDRQLSEVWRLRRQWSDAVLGQLATIPFTAQDRDYLRFCTEHGWQVPKPI